MGIKDRIILFLLMTTMGFVSGVSLVFLFKVMAYFGALSAWTHEESILTVIFWTLFGVLVGFYEGFLRRRW